MRIFYYLSGYISHRLAGLEYISCLRCLGHDVSCNYQALRDGGAALIHKEELAERVRRADLFILHEEPHICDDLLFCLPELRQTPLVIYLPWENEALPKEWLAPLTQASNIWTCSEFSRQAFSRVYANTEVLPHVVRRPKATPEALRWGKEMLQRHGAEGAALFLSVMDGLNPRKNLSGLLAAFGILRRKSPRPVKLLVKQYRAALPLEDYPDVISIPEMLDDGRMAALYALSNAYISPHHAEGWGLSLSASMALGKTVIATGYSGNLEFMNPKNSLLLPYTIVQVSQKMTTWLPLFRPEMRWAEPDLPSMVRAMLLVAEERIPPALNREASRITEYFGPEQICIKLKKMLEKAAVRKNICV